MKKANVMANVLIAGLAALGMTNAFAQSDADFLKSYKDSFIKSCTDSAGATGEAACRCVLNEVTNQFSVADLKDEKKVTEFIEKVALGKCDP